MLRTIARRWYAAFPVFCLVALFGPGIVASADPEYRASGSVVLLPSDPTAAGTPSSDEDAVSNPYTEFSGSVSITAAVLENIGNGDAVRERVAASGGTANFTIEQDEETPILLIEATSINRKQAIATVGMVAGALDAELSARQERFAVPPAERIVLEDVLLPTRAAQLDSSRNRALTIVIAFGIGGVVASTVLVDSIVKGRARKRGAAVASARRRVGEPPVGEDSVFLGRQETTSSVTDANGDVAARSEHVDR